MTEIVQSYVKLGIAALLPVFMAIIFHILDTNTPFKKLNYWIRQIIYGIFFGALAIVGTEWGIPMSGAQVNCRDSAVLTAGLFFGAPAGIIAGFIGGIERWIAVYWGVGSFTRIACSVSTIIAGFYAAGLRKFMFENRRPSFIFSFAIGLIMEVFHLTMVFVTNMADTERAMEVVKVCSVPMITANALSVMLSGIVLTVLSHQKLGVRNSKLPISQIIQRWLLIPVILAFLVTTLFVYAVQNATSKAERDANLSGAITDVKQDILDSTDQAILNTTKEISRMLMSWDDLKAVAEQYDVTEISKVNASGIIFESNIPEYIGFDMNSSPQSASFLCLLEDTESFVQEYGPTSLDPSVFRKYAGVKTAYGFLQVGYDEDHFDRYIDKEMTDLTKNRHIGKTGYIVILNSDYELVSGPKGHTAANVAYYRAAVQNSLIGETKEIKIAGEKYFAQYGISEGYYILSLITEAEANRNRNITLYVNIFMEVLIFAILFIMVYALVKTIVVRPMRRVNRSLDKITDGDLNEHVNVNTSSEFTSLSGGLNTMVNRLKELIAEAEARIDKELAMAKSIQMSALPALTDSIKSHPEFEIYARMDTAKEVGGDFYDFYMTDAKELNFLIADVSGKGIPAAMFMMQAKTELKTLTETKIPLQDVFTQGNEKLCEGNDAGMFVTAWQGCLNLEEKLIRFCNAGHNPPLIRKKDGTFEYVNMKKGFVLAGMEGLTYKAQEVSFEPGDTIFLYTDGVTEATNTSNELFGEDRLREALNDHPVSSMQELCDFVKERVDAFVGDAPQFDDITMVALTFRGK